ncbi:50S ribosomal protein L11 methyltransferase [Leisingera sp. JC1]|uniref:50S ribosomal protein L11 methyltransferase n=1 Tax=Leisingera sp. JC1 TaxID=1855282 RepID=UPI000802DCA6|nr:50S ribosomal protein L11 methyltransferase [Leisingera sp. JC1]OBY28603.1 hypothetical protein A9D60_00255 [Leisingera sp. JC1]
MPERLPPARFPENPILNAQDANSLVQTAKSAPLTDGGLQTAQLLSEALSLDPSHHEAQILQERLHQTFVPRWHFPMLSDTARNKAYAKAIAAKVKPGDVVLDIGCGAGLTAMLAARSGAKHVYTCEQQPLIAQAATRVIAANGLSDRITVIPKWSHEIVVGADIPEQADVVISEIVDTVLLGEGALATLTHAMSALAKPGARAIPERGTLLAQPVESSGLLDLWRPQEAEGFDLSAFHHFARVAQLTPNDFEACKLRPLGPAAELFEFDFTRPNINPARVVKDLACTAPGSIHAVLISFEMNLAPGVQVANGLTSGGHWGRTAFLLDHPETAKAGDLLRVIAQHDAAQLSLSVHELLQAAQEPAAAALWMTRAWKANHPLQADHEAAVPQAPVCPRSQPAQTRPLDQAYH